MIQIEESTRSRLIGVLKNYSAAYSNLLRAGVSVVNTVAPELTELVYQLENASTVEPLTVYRRVDLEAKVAALEGIVKALGGGVWDVEQKCLATNFSDRYTVGVTLVESEDRAVMLIYDRKRKKFVGRAEAKFPISMEVSSGNPLGSLVEYVAEREDKSNATRPLTD